VIDEHVRVGPRGANLAAPQEPDSRDSPPFVVANSMREVQPEINLLVSPIKDNLVYIAPPDAPKWVMPEEMS
jgi:hypothetical protein